MKVIGSIIRCMEKVFILGPMEGLTKENISKIRNMEKGFIIGNFLYIKEFMLIGLMAKNILENGTMIYVMDMGPWYCLMDNRSKLTGNMEKG